MVFTQTEINFLEENRDLIDKGKPSLGEVVSKVLNHGILDFSKSKMIFAIIYSVEGPEGFLASVSQEYVTSPIKGALLNRTSAKASGVALIPSMFSAKTKVVFYRIENNKIVSELKSRLVDIATYKKELNEGNYNLVVLDTPESINSVKEAFEGIIAYTVRFEIKLDSISRNLAVVKFSQKDPNKVKEKAENLLVENLFSKIGGMKSAIDLSVKHVLSKPGLIG